MTSILYVTVGGDSNKKTRARNILNAENQYNCERV